MKNSALTARFCLVAASVAAMTTIALPAQAGLAIGNVPLFLIQGKANVLIVLDNSNSMDESPQGFAVGSASPNSKSEIARGVVRSLTTKYQGRISMGLMGYKQYTLRSSHIADSQYDVSYNPDDYAPGDTGPSNSQKKKYRILNPSSPGEYLYYNVRLPMYGVSYSSYCYSPTAIAFNGNASSDLYKCYSSKTGPANDGTGLSGYLFGNSFSATDSDIAAGYSSWGKNLTWQYVSRTWNSDFSPGRGFLHVPIADLTAAQAATLTSKLACNIPSGSAPCTTTGMQNGGLTPLEGTLLTALDYFGGSWSNSSEGYVASCYPLPQSCGKNFVILLTDGLPSTDRNGTNISDPASAITATAAAAAALKAAGTETYVIGFATDSASLNKIASSGGTDTAYNASDSASLQSAFDAIFNDIARKTSAIGSISQNSPRLDADSRLFSNRFDSSDWSGEVFAIKPGTGNTADTVLWSTNTAGLIPAAADRKVFTTASTGGGIAFKLLTGLSTAQQAYFTSPACGGTLSTTAACGQARVDWLRGDFSNDANNGGPLRARSRKMGDVIYGSPAYVPDTKTVYIGANDGMMHAFDAVSGSELFAYVPNLLMPKLYKLTQTSYAHEYYVDGDIAVSTRTQTSGRNILVGALGRGGSGLYALDVTDPAGFDASKVMWEFTDPDLGLVTSTPVIVKLNNGKTGVIVGNGVNSANDRSFIFVIDITNGTLIAKLDTKTGSSTSPNGMAGVAGWDDDANGTVDYLFAGDRLGNVWKWDIRAASASSWAPALGTTVAPAPIFIAKDSTGKLQPITSKVTLGLDMRKGDPNMGKLFVFFGTGQYLVSTDPGDTSVQTWYGLVDGATAVSGRSSLVQRTLSTADALGTATVRTFSTAAANDMSGKRGWYVDLVTSGLSATGERMFGDSRLIGNVLMAVSNVPSTNVCSPGGTSWTNAIDPFSGGNLSNVYFDVNGDGAYDSGDRLNGKAVGSIASGSGLSGTPVLIGDKTYKKNTGSSQMETQRFNSNQRSGRVAWREIVRQP